MVHMAWTKQSRTLLLQQLTKPMILLLDFANLQASCLVVHASFRQPEAGTICNPYRRSELCDRSLHKTPAIRGLPVSCSLCI